MRLCNIADGRRAAPHIGVWKQYICLQVMASIAPPVHINDLQSSSAMSIQFRAKALVRSIAQPVCLAVAAASLVACSSPAPAPVVPAVWRGPVLAIDQTERGVQIVLPSSVLFDVGQASFNQKEAGPYLDRVAKLLTSKTDKRVAVEGHTDADGAPNLNEQLSLARARAVSAALVSRGVPEARLQSAGFSFNRPLASNSTEDGKRLNRRVELIVLDEQIANLTQGEPANAFESAWGRLKGLIDQGLVKPVVSAAP